MIKYWLIVVFGSLYILVAISAMVYIIRRGLLAHLHHKRQDKISLRAKVKHKLVQQGFHGVDWQIGSVAQAMVFECEDGEERQFDVTQAIWEITDEGDVGTLTFQGEHVLEFRSRHHKRHLDDTYERLTRR